MDASRPAIVVINGIGVDLGSERLHDRNGKSISLRPQTFAVLRHFLANPNRVVTKEELMGAVWPGIVVTDDSLVQCLHEIRRAFGDSSHTIFATVPRRGYRLSVAVDVTATPAARRGYPVAILAVCLLAMAVVALWWMSPGRATLSGKPTVAVQPFAALDGDEASQRLARGMTADIVTDLTRFPEFRVVAVEPVSGVEADSADADFRLEGSVQRQQGRIRITAQFVEAATGSNLWSDRWDRPDGDFFAIQSSISEQVSNRMGGGAGLVQTAGRNMARRKAPENLNAYELYLLGTEKLEHITKADIDEAIRLLEKAVELDPGLARAWAELFHCYSMAVSYGGDAAVLMPKAHHAAEKAVSLDPGDAEAHAVLGKSLAAKGEYERSRAEFDTALKMAPGAAEILIFYIGWASTLGEPEKGADLIAEAIRLDPNYPMWADTMFSYAYFMAGRYEESLKMLHRQADDNYNRDTLMFRIGALNALNRREEVKIWVAKALARLPDLNVEAMANDLTYSPKERQRFVDTMRDSGLPLCATAEQIAAIPNAVRLEECSQVATK